MGRDSSQREGKGYTILYDKRFGHKEKERERKKKKKERKKDKPSKHKVTDPKNVWLLDRVT